MRGRLARYSRGGGNPAFCCSFGLHAWCSALPAGVLSFASPKESSQRKGDRRVDAPLRGVPCATRLAGRLAKLACGSNRRQPTAPGQPALLGVSKAAFNTTRFSTVFRVHRRRWFGERFPLPLRGAEQRSRWRKKGRGLSEGRSPEFRSTPPTASSAGNRRSRHRPWGRLLFGYFFLAKQEKVRPPARRNPTFASRKNNKTLDSRLRGNDAKGLVP